MNLITRAIQKPSIYERNPRFGGPDTLLQIDARAPLFIHNAQFDRMFGQPKNRFHTAKDFVRKRNLFRPVHFGFHHIDRPMRRIADPLPAGIMAGDHSGDHRIHQAFAHFVAVTVLYRWVGHQMPNIPDQHQCAGLHLECSTACVGIGQVPRHATCLDLATLFKALFQIALHQTKPVGIGQNLVFGIDRSHGIFAIHDCRHRGFQTDIRNSSGITCANGAGCIHNNFDAQTIVLEKIMIRPIPTTRTFKGTRIF